jgi:hypothetical protein
MAARQLTIIQAMAALALVVTCARAVPAPVAAPAVGTTAAPFHLLDQAGVGHSSSDYCGKWLVSYFYQHR